jgi:hypothetical protein
MSIDLFTSTECHKCHTQRESRCPGNCRKLTRASSPFTARYSRVELVIAYTYTYVVEASSPHSNDQKISKRTITYEPLKRSPQPNMYSRPDKAQDVLANNESFGTLKSFTSMFPLSKRCHAIGLIS